MKRTLTTLVVLSVLVLVVVALLCQPAPRDPVSGFPLVEPGEVHIRLGPVWTAGPDIIYQDGTRLPADTPSFHVASDQTRAEHSVPGTCPVIPADVFPVVLFLDSNGRNVLSVRRVKDGSRLPINQ